MFRYGWELLPFVSLARKKKRNRFREVLSPLGLMVLLMAQS
jgi:hypothetical protein